MAFMAPSILPQVQPRPAEPVTDAFAVGWPQPAGYNEPRRARTPCSRLVAEPAERADALADLPGSVARRRPADEVRRAADPGHSQGARRGGDLRDRRADRLARRVRGAPPQAGHASRPDNGPAGRQAPHVGGV